MFWLEMNHPGRGMGRLAEASACFLAFLQFRPIGRTAHSRSIRSCSGWSAFHSGRLFGVGNDFRDLFPEYSEGNGSHCRGIGKYLFRIGVGLLGEVEPIRPVHARSPALEAV